MKDEKFPLCRSGLAGKVLLPYWWSVVDSSIQHYNVLLLLSELLYCKILHHCNLNTRVQREGRLLGCMNQLDMQWDHQCLQHKEVTNITSLQA